MNIQEVSAVSPFAEYSAAITLTFDQAINVWLMHWKGEAQQQIAARLGTNALRVDAVLNERQHVGSREKAYVMYTH